MNADKTEEQPKNTSHMYSVEKGHWRINRMNKLFYFYKYIKNTILKWFTFDTT